MDLDELLGHPLDRARETIEKAAKGVKDVVEPILDGIIRGITNLPQGKKVQEKQLQTRGLSADGAQELVHGQLPVGSVDRLLLSEEMGDAAGPAQTLLGRFT